MHKISICWIDHCNNDFNTFDNCEDYISLRLKTITIEDLTSTYNKFLERHKVSLITSSTLINWESAQDHLFDEIMYDLFWCLQLKDMIHEMYFFSKEKPCKTCIEILAVNKARVWAVLYWQRRNFDAIGF